MLKVSEAMKKVLAPGRRGLLARTKIHRWLGEVMDNTKGRRGCRMSCLVAF